MAISSVRPACRRGYLCRYDDAKLPLRLSNYQSLLDAPAGPIRREVAHAHLIADLTYQLMRLQLLADQLEQHDPTVNAVRLVLSAPADNHGVLRALPTRLPHSTDATAVDVASLWSSSLTRRDRFAWVDNPVLASRDSPTSTGYSERYGGP